LYEDGVSPIGYQLELAFTLDGLIGSEAFRGWNTSSDTQQWLIGRLYNGHGDKDDLGSPFFTLPVFMCNAPKQGGR
jgi:hypothetical protein